MAELNSANNKLSSREQRDLDIEIQFLEGVVRRDRRYVEALQLPVSYTHLTLPTKA